MSAISGETTIVKSAQRDRRKLVAETLAGSGRHDADHIVSGEHVFDHLALAADETASGRNAVRQ